MDVCGCMWMYVEAYITAYMLLYSEMNLLLYYKNFLDFEYVQVDLKLHPLTH